LGFINGFIKAGVIRRSAVTVLAVLVVLVKIAAAESERGDYVKQRRAAVEEYVKGHYGEAETLFLNAFHSAETNRDDYATALNLSGLGDVYQTESRYDEAEAAYRKSLSIFRRTPNADLVVAIELHNLGSSYTAAHRYREALAALNESSQLAEKAEPPRAELTGQILNSLGVVYFYEEKAGKAEKLFQSAIRTYSAGGNTWAADLAQSFNNLAELYRGRRQFQKAEDAYKKSITLIEERLGPAHPDLILILDNLGDVYADQKRYAEAEAQYRRSLAILEKVEPLLTVRMIHTLHGLSRIYLETGYKAEAEEVLARAATVAGPRPATNPEVPEVLETYSRLLKSAGKSQQAEDLHWRATQAIASMTLTVRVQDLK
jgi:tetratricopeptide (TPR) repeat protein